ncbi:ATP12 family chaperone protein [Bartonella tamiae]|uniref:ATP12 chaperone n=1 Tax=Bartonella tamiae Th239 TaxID=1094558 RepID=J0ZKS9_9HYPH|nr:ATP12 family protein [Bartonella tamiae]EJF88953.1 hypothetical protein ME5_01504 [Bartonella tamiae Th239]EJF94797.1 hypothetical protein MEG_00378 [Bartonella tamiae Th307]
MREILNDTGENTFLKKAQNISQQSFVKRFYDNATVVPTDNGFAVLLDGKCVKTPGRKELIVPNQDLATHLSVEFNVQEDFIDPRKMSITRLVNTVIDGVADNREAVEEDILRFLASDLLFYRATSPKELVDRQTKLWDPIIDWFERKWGYHFVLSEGVMHVDQPRDAILTYGRLLRDIKSPFIIAALHNITTLSGSALLAMALYDKYITSDEAWKLAHLEEDWTIEHWGEDQEALKMRHNKRKDFDAAVLLLDLL